MSDYNVLKSKYMAIYYTLLNNFKNYNYNFSITKNKNIKLFLINFHFKFNDFFFVNLILTESFWIDLTYPP